MMRTWLMFSGLVFFFVVLGCRPGTLATETRSETDDSVNEEISGGGKEEPPCRLDTDIYVPLAQARPVQIIPENREATHGAHTMVNTDIDAGGNALLARIQNQNDLNNVSANNDLVVAPIVGEDDLVRIDLKNPDNLNPAILNAYAFALENGRNVAARNRTQSPLTRNMEIKIWRSASKAGNMVQLPYVMNGASETLYVEGLKAGRYRLVLFHSRGMNRQKARNVKATIRGNALNFPGPAQILLELQERQAGRLVKTPIACFDHVRLTIAKVDIYQDRREDIYDFLLGGRPIVRGRLWPRGGQYVWSQNPGLQGQWLNGRVHGVNVRNRGQVAVEGNAGSIQRIRAAFEHQLPAINAAANGSATLYVERWLLLYDVEGVLMTRGEPATVMVPRIATVVPQVRRVFPAPGMIMRGGANQFNFGVIYRIFERQGRRLVGDGNQTNYQRQYGSSIAVYEALGPRVNAAELGDNLTHTFTSRAGNPQVQAQRSYTLNIRTAQRSRALRTRRLRTSGEFPDNFGYGLNNRQRNGLQQEIRAGLLAPNAIIFDVAQDVVALLDNGTVTYDIRVVTGNRLQVFAPNQLPGNVLGPIGFRFNLGAGNGTRILTNNPIRLPNNHNP